MPVQTRSMKKNNTAASEFETSSVQTRSMRKDSIFEPRPLMLRKQPTLDASDEMPTTAEKILDCFNYTLICACSFLSFLFIYAGIFYGIEYNLTKMYPELLNSIDQIRFIYGLCWTLLLTRLMNYYM
jgi:hypothetical protein